MNRIALTFAATALFIATGCAAPKGARGTVFIPPGHAASQSVAAMEQAERASESFTPFEGTTSQPEARAPGFGHVPADVGISERVREMQHCWRCQ